MGNRAEIPAVSVLEQETAFYERERAALAANYSGRYLLIYGDRLVDDFETMEDATTEGVRMFGSEPILVRLAGEDAPVASLTTIF